MYPIGVYHHKQLNTLISTSYIEGMNNLVGWEWDRDWKYKEINRDRNTRTRTHAYI